VTENQSCIVGCCHRVASDWPSAAWQSGESVSSCKTPLTALSCTAEWLGRLSVVCVTCQYCLDSAASSSQNPTFWVVICSSVI